MIENSGLRHFKAYHPSVKEMMSPHHYGQRDAHDCYINKALHKYKKIVNSSPFSFRTQTKDKYVQPLY